MHVRVRLHPDTMCPTLTMVIGPFGYEDWNPALEKVWREQQATILDEPLSSGFGLATILETLLESNFTHTTSLAGTARVYHQQDSTHDRAFAAIYAPRVGCHYLPAKAMGTA
ncbi:uncharacterized protein H6S33_008706 [Morchella sextelata]|uniref:uncharacterized protein n=1 Tax=Morchella sextelata TaxID=1174677 RepID=UPI001D03A774|nr:uncharacterized protein H6S33_008706 [Morchella sextelata]KAH0602367.1 hypothetical protein H6S33_008706 [Morchella sextelata]